jgi:hypothetical protein
MMAVTVMMSASDEDQMEMIAYALQHHLHSSINTPEAAAKQKKQKKALGWETV